MFLHPENDVPYKFQDHSAQVVHIETQFRPWWMQKKHHFTTSMQKMSQKLLRYCLVLSIMHFVQKSKSKTPATSFPAKQTAASTEPTAPTENQLYS